MKTIINHISPYVLTIMLLLLFHPSGLLFAQSKTTIGFSAGYGMLNMKEVNSDLKDTYQVLQSANIHASSPEEIEGGLFVDGNFLVRLEKISLGASVNYITGNGNLTYSDFSGSIEESYDASTIEIMGIIGTNVPFNQTVSLSLRGYAGYGIASVNHIGRINFFASPQDNINVTNDVSGGYFAARIQGGIEILVEPLILNFSLAYRIANAGKLKGDMTENGISFSNMGIRNARGGDIEFDYSGITFMAGIQFQL